MKIEANGLARRGVASIFATNIFAATMSETAMGDGLKPRPHD